MFSELAKRLPGSLDLGPSPDTIAPIGPEPSAEASRSDRKATERQARAEATQAEWAAQGILFKSTKCVYDDRNHWLIIYGDRVEILRTPIISVFKKEERDTIPMRNVTSVDVSTGAVFGKLAVASMGKVSAIDKLNKAEAQKAKAIIEEQAAAAHHALVGAGTATTPQPDIADQIKKLADLRDAGILTEEEFATKKAELLDRM